jgi:hypothetical protein
MIVEHVIRNAQDATGDDGTVAVTVGYGGEPSTGETADTNRLRVPSATLTVADVIDPGGDAQRSLHPAMSALEKALEPHESVVKGGPLYGDGAKFLVDLEKSITQWRDGGDGFLVQKLREEATLAGSTISPGRVKGRFYLISRKDKHIVCIADIDVTGPRGFLAWGETNADLTRNAATQLPPPNKYLAAANALEAHELRSRSLAVQERTPANEPGRIALANMLISLLDDFYDATTAFFEHLHSEMGETPANWGKHDLIKMGDEYWSLQGTVFDIHKRRAAKKPAAP